MGENNLFISDLFREQLLQFCSNDFIRNNISWQGFRVYELGNNPISLIEVSSFVRDNNYQDALTKVRFCLAWLQAVTANVQNPHRGVVFFDGFGYISIRFTDFLCQLTISGIITREEHMHLSHEWIDITNGTPFYQ